MPSHHSSSSHSSSSRSSSRSSRSSSSSSRSHSSSSRSSGSRSSYSSGRSYSSGPSRHSSSSHSSSYSFGGSRASAGRPSARPSPAPDRRPRINQPVGFLITETLRPSYYYGRRHDYVYYPESWTDTASGAHYEKGYYDENGKYYDSVAFQKNGRYENVVCRCPYCDTKRILNLDNRSGASQSMQCPNCGGPMEIESELDEIVSQPAENTHVYNSEESLRGAFGQRRKKRRPWLPIAIILIVVLLLSRMVKSLASPVYQLPEQNGPVQQLSLTEQNLYLEKQADGSYHRVTDPLRADRILSYDAYEDSYCDETGEYWLWYNIDVDPPVWQYWVEGISSDFGDCGWMEHDSDGWWIEASQGNWIPLPDKYDTDSLWYIS